MKKKLVIPVILILILSLFSTAALAADWPQFAFDQTNNSITDSLTPVSAAEAELFFQARVREATSWDGISNVIIVGDAVYAASGSKLIKISMDGEIIDEAALPASISSSPYIAAGDGQIFIYVYDGTAGYVQAIDAATMELGWTSEPVAAMESFSPLTYADGTLYLAVSGYDYAQYQVLPGAVLAISAAAGTDQGRTLKFNFSDEVQAYYWNGAAVSEQYLYIGSMQGHIQVLDLENGTLVDQIDTGDSIKTSLTLSDNELFFGTAGGAARISLDDQGMLDDQSLLTLDLGVQVTTTPLVHAGRLYVGTGSFAGGSGFYVIDASAMTALYSVKIPGIDSWSNAEIAIAGIQSTPVLTTAYDDIYVYYTINAKPGSLIRIKDSASTTEADFEIIFEPDEADQNATLAALAADGKGTIYYTNDSGLLFAVGRSEQPEPVDEQPEPVDEQPEPVDEQPADQEDVPKTGRQQSTPTGWLLLTFSLAAAALLTIRADKKHRRE